jgi:hypothetical protein
LSRVISLELFRVIIVLKLEIDPESVIKNIEDLNGKDEDGKSPLMIGTNFVA